jgi:hypothetical protein
MHRERAWRPRSGFAGRSKGREQGGQGNTSGLSHYDGRNHIL